MRGGANLLAGRFLETMAMSNGQESNYQSIARDAGVLLLYFETFLKKLW